MNLHLNKVSFCEQIHLRVKAVDVIPSFPKTACNASQLNCHYQMNNNLYYQENGFCDFFHSIVGSNRSFLP